MQHYNSYMEVNLGNLCANVDYIKKSVGASCDVVPVLKGNAYGHGLVLTADALVKRLNIRTLAVAQIYEGAMLRRAGFGGEIMLLAGMPCAFAPAAVSDRLIIPVSTTASAQALSFETKAQGKKYIPVQVVVDTGLNRFGVSPGEELDALLACIKNTGNLYVKGVYTHFADAEDPQSRFAYEQLEKFGGALEQVALAGIKPEMIHASNSAASEWLPEAYFDAVRIGRRLYMDNRSQIAAGADPENMPIKEVASFRSEIIGIKTVKAGERAGYRQHYRTPKTTVIATVCAGYSDGVQKSFAGKNAPVLVGNATASYIGVCMDQTLLDVTDIPCEVGCEVTFFGRSSDGRLLSAQTVGETVGEEGVYLTSMLTDRVIRKYI